MIKPISVNTIYPAFDGEQNPFGIGCPTIFVRFQGCHLRCYLKTLNVLCDTPEALEVESKHAKEYEVEDLVEVVVDMAQKYGIEKITLTGGDPLFRHNAETLNAFYEGITSQGLSITVETSGTIDWTKFKRFPNVYYILDWKLHSTGIPKKLNKLINYNRLKGLQYGDFIKFVVHDKFDYEEMLQALDMIEAAQCRADVVAGVYFNGPVSTFDLFDWLKRDSLFNKVKINIQSHQLESYRVKNEGGKDPGKDI